MASRWADSHLVAGTGASASCHTPRLGRIPRIILIPQTGWSIFFFFFLYISKGNRLPTFQPATSSHQQKSWFDTLALCFWCLIDAAVSGSLWHLAPAATLPQAVSSLGPHAEKGKTNSGFRWATLQGQPPRSTTGLVVHEACCLFTSGLDHARPWCQSHSCLPSLRSLGPCWSRDIPVWVTAPQFPTIILSVRLLCSRL